MKVLVTLVALIMGTLFLGASTAAAATGHSIRGTVVDGTAGAALPTGLVAHLTSTSTDASTFPERTSPVGADGQFSFEDVPTDTGFVGQVTVDYGGASYRAALPPAGAAGSSTVSLKVYEPTTSEDVLRLDSANWVVEAIDDQSQQVVVLETMTLVNTSDHAYVGDHRGDPGSDSPGVLPRTLRLYLPPGASGFEPDTGLNSASLLPVAGGFVDTDPVLPGVRQIAYTYRIAYAEGGMEIRKALPYPTKKLRVLIPNVGLDIRTDRLTAAGTADVAGRSFQVLSADNVPANQNVTVDALGFPISPTARLDPQLMTTIGLAIVGLAVLAALVLGLRPNRPRTDRAEAGG